MDWEKVNLKWNWQASLSFSTYAAMALMGSGQINLGVKAEEEGCCYLPIGGASHCPPSQHHAPHPGLCVIDKAAGVPKQFWVSLTRKGRVYGYFLLFQFGVNLTFTFIFLGVIHFIFNIIFIFTFIFLFSFLFFCFVFCLQFFCLAILSLLATNTSNIKQKAKI